MDLGRTQLTGLLNNVSHEKTKFIQIFHKIKSILALSKDHKLIFTSIEKLLLTSTPSTIYENIQFTHPILKILLEFLYKTKKMGDGEKVFIDILKVLIDKISFLIDSGIKPKMISDLLKDIKIDLAAFNNEDVVDKISDLNINTSEEKQQFRLVETVRSFVRELIDEETIPELLIEAIEYTGKMNLESIRTIKIPTGSTEDSFRLDGILLPRIPEGKIKTLKETSIGVFNCPLDINRTELKGTILMKNADELLSFSNSEVERAKAIVNSLNVNIVVISGNINDLFLDFIDSRNILVIRVFNKYDLKRIADLVGSEINMSLGPIINKGSVNSVDVVTFGDQHYTRIIAKGNVNTIVIKNSIREKCDEIESKIINTLQTLEKNAKVMGMGNNLSEENQKTVDSASLPVFSSAGFYETVSKLIGNSTVVNSIISQSIKKAEFRRMLLKDHVKCLKYSLDFLATVLEIDDYLVAKADQLDIKPRDNPNWDED